MLFVTAAMALAAGHALAGPAEDQYAVAAGHYKEKRWKFAAEEFQTFLADHPQHANAAKARFYLAESLLQLRRYDEAGQTFRAFIEQAPQDRLTKKARFRAAESDYLAGHFDRAKIELAAFAQALPDDPLNGYALPYLADIALRAGDLKQSQELYREALTRFPQGPLQDDCRFGLARALEGQGQGEEARRLYLALAAKPKSAWSGKAQFRLGANFYAAAEYDQALACFEEIVGQPRFAASPLRMQAALAAGEALLQLNRLDDAQQRFEALLEDKAVGAEAHYSLGLTQAARKDWAAAAPTLLAAAEQARDDAKLAPAARFHAGDALLHAGKPAEARGQYELVLKTWPQSEFAEKSLLGLMQVASSTGDHQKVDELASQFGERYPNTSLKPHVDGVVGRSLIERKDYVAAAAIFERLVAGCSDPSSRRVDDDLCLLASAYVGQTRYEDALKILASVALAPTPADEERALWIDVQRQRAAALVGLERFAQAAQVLDQLLAAHPDAKAGAWARAELAVCLAKTNQLERAKMVFAELAGQPVEGDVAAAATLAVANAALDQDDAAWAGELFAKLASGPSGFQARALWGLARSQAKQGDAAQAASALEKLLADHGNDPLAPEAALARGQLLEQLKNDEAALASYQKVIDGYQSSPQLPQAMLAAARVEQRLKRPQDAAAMYERLDKAYPQSPEHEAVWYEWAWALREAGEPEHADEVFERLRSQKPHGRFWSDAVYRLAERAFEMKDYPRAEQLTAELIGGEPAGQVLPHALYLQAQIAAAQNQWLHVPAPLERLIAEFPDNPIVPLAQYLVAEAAYREGQYERAAELFRELDENTRGRNDKWAPMVPLRRAQILAHNKEWHDALEIASQIETDYPDFEQQYEVDYVIGRCQAGLALFDDARAAYRRVVKSTSGEKTETAAKAQWMIGETFFHQKNYEAALKEYLKVEILYDFPTWQAAALFEAAKCHEHLGELKHAADLYQRLIKNFPESPLAKDAAERLKSNDARAQK
ncbi:MAG TPA: tetratricopeptide repeat protein [Pirellulales bacterium]|nr:tetratricopeptide repeat protein [Pirellulales bacterium]